MNQTYPLARGMTVMGITQRSGEVRNCLLTGTMKPPINWAHQLNALFINRRDRGLQRRRPRESTAAPYKRQPTTRPTAGGTMLDGQRIGQARLTSCPAAATPSSDSLDRCRQHFARTERLAVTECSAPERAKRSPLRAAPWQRSFSCSFSSLQGRNDRSALAIFELDNAARSRHLELFATLRRRWRIGSIACSISWRAAGSSWRFRIHFNPHGVRPTLSTSTRQTLFRCASVM